ncbi:MAG: DUF5060 domain-containing protein [Ferruginibacter sp.]
MKNLACFPIAFLSLCMLHSVNAQKVNKPLAVPVINAVTANNNLVSKFNKLELVIDLTAAFSNAYDYSEIVVQCVFTAPSGRKDTVDGFFMQDYTLNVNGSLTAVGSGSFKVRYAPNEPGSWIYNLSCTNAEGTGVYPVQSFQCVASSEPGFIRKNSTNYLSFDNGTQFFPVGENMGWQSSNVVTDYTNWISDLTANGANFIRVWMSSWAFGLEWKNNYNGFSGLKKYKQSSAYYFDWLLDYCKQNNVYVMNALNNHGQVSTGVNPEWTDNPYNAANGGPAANTWDFFTDNTAKAFHKNRLRYIIARYGYSQAIQSWELFNEVDWTDQFATRRTDVKNWHEEMANYIKSKDVYKHLVTTSFARDMYDDATWNIPAIDFTQTHYYVDAPNIENTIASGVQTYLTNYQKPTLNGEFGLGPDGNVLSAVDPSGVHIHNAIWGTSFSGSLGSGMSWWWDTYLHPRSLFNYYKPLTTVLNGIEFVKDDYKKTSASTSGGGAADATIVPAADFGSSTALNFTIDGAGNISPAAGQLGKYLYGSQWNTQYKTPPTFNVNYPIAGQFKVVTGSGTGTSPTIDITVDGVVMLSTNAAISTTYSVNIPAGVHAIKVDNLGTDWILISNYVFTNIGSPLTVYALKSANNGKVAGYILNNNYNWKYLQSSGGAVPPAINGASLQMTGLQNGACSVDFYSCATGLLVSSTTNTVTTGTLNLPLPSIAWDLAFKISLNVYKFIGNGNWNDPANWSNNNLPPSLLPAGAEISIDPPLNGECLLNVAQTISAGAKLTVEANKKFRITGDLNIQ